LRRGVYQKGDVESSSKNILRKRKIVISGDKEQRDKVWSITQSLSIT